MLIYAQITAWDLVEEKDALKAKYETDLDENDKM